MINRELEKELLRIKDSESDYLIPSHSEVYQKVLNQMASPFKNSDINKVVGLDMKGLMYGPVIADRLKVPFVPILKGGKIGDRELVVQGEGFIDYSGKRKSIELFKSSIKKTDRILLIDDWFESGETGRSAISLIEQLGGTISGISVIFNQLKPIEEESFSDYNFHFLVRLIPKE
ncbi:MAG: phosphoribosyltransferase family protein [Candidatus Woesearchaeota archaeon]